MVVAGRYAHTESFSLNQCLMSTITITCWFSCTSEKMLSQKQHDAICINHNSCLYLFYFSSLYHCASKVTGAEVCEGGVKAEMSQWVSSSSPQLWDALHAAAIHPVHPVPRYLYLSQVLHACTEASFPLLAHSLTYSASFWSEPKANAEPDQAGWTWACFMVGSIPKWLVPHVILSPYVLVPCQGRGYNSTTQRGFLCCISAALVSGSQQIIAGPSCGAGFFALWVVTQKHMERAFL